MVSNALLIRVGDGAFTGLGTLNTKFGTTLLGLLKNRSAGVGGQTNIDLPSDADASTRPLAVDNYGGSVRMYAGNGNVTLQTSDTHTTYYWNFDKTGNLTTPGNISAGGTFYSHSIVPDTDHHWAIGRFNRVLDNVWSDNLDSIGAFASHWRSCAPQTCTCQRQTPLLAASRSSSHQRSETSPIAEMASNKSAQW